MPKSGNIALLLLNIGRPGTLLLLNISRFQTNHAGMKQNTLIPALAAMCTLLAMPAAAGCYADYKAKRDDPLRLHYGTIEITGKACSKKAAEKQIRNRIGADGWTLLNVLGVFDETGLAERKESAGKFHLRY